MVGQAKRAYRKLCLLLHPDRGGDQELFKTATDCYNTIREHQDLQLTGEDLYVPVKLDEEDVKELANSGQIVVEIKLQRTEQLKGTVQRTFHVPIQLDKLDQVVVVRGLGEEGYPDGNLVLFFENLIFSDSSVLVFKV